ncbi:YdbC family protein [Cetobacterium sp. SF1]|uniref:YdbC family protein n=1 Tax=Cetobacterium sp. SF1 TaxID=3417654 RepID=UPI003CF84C79
MAEIKFEIIENLGILGEGSKGWSKELNLISWNSRKPKLDIRDWDEDHEKMGKGITLSKEEVKNLKELLNSIDLDKLDM